MKFFNLEIPTTPSGKTGKAALIEQMNKRFAGNKTSLIGISNTNNINNNNPISASKANENSINSNIKKIGILNI